MLTFLISGKILSRSPGIPPFGPEKNLGKRDWCVDRTDGWSLTHLADAPEAEINITGVVNETQHIQETRPLFSRRQDWQFSRPFVG
jgi:predicted NAD/FAD-dependent oxidoreductase